MDFLIIGGVFAMVACIAAGQHWFSDRQWVGMWRGHRVSLRHMGGRVVVEVDGQEVLSQARKLIGQTYAEAWSHAALGETTIQLSKRTIGSQGEFDMLMSIGEERVPLIELEQAWKGARALFLLRTRSGDPEECWSSLMHTSAEPLGDDRWLAACRLLVLTRQSSALTASMREAANELQGVLRRSFEARQRLGDVSLAVLGAEDPDEVSRVQLVLEDRIVSALEAVKSLHMAVISIESQADESSELSRVHQALDMLQADSEVERFMKRQSMLQAAQSKRQ
jgi:hypothetical protein